MFDVVAIGELLIDFVQTEVSKTGGPVFQANPGGAPCNVLAMLQKLGLKTAFIGKVGNDIFGHRLKMFYLRSESIQKALFLTNIQEPRWHL